MKAGTKVRVKLSANDLNKYGHLRKYNNMTGVVQEDMPWVKKGSLVRLNRGINSTGVVGLYDTMLVKLGSGFKEWAQTKEK